MPNLSLVQVALNLAVAKIFTDYSLYIFHVQQLKHASHALTHELASNIQKKTF